MVYRFKIDGSKMKRMIIVIPKFRFLFTLNRRIKREFEISDIFTSKSHIQANITYEARDSRFNNPYTRESKKKLKFSC